MGTGLVGAGAVALWFLVLDILTSSPFYTPAALGSAVWLGADSPGEVRYNVALIGAYTVLHVAAFVVVGVALAWVATHLERRPAWWLFPVLAFVVLEGLFLGAVGVVSEWVLGALGWWAIGIGNLAAVGTMVWWLAERHPRLREVVAGRLVETRV